MAVKNYRGCVYVHAHAPANYSRSLLRQLIVDAVIGIFYNAWFIYNSVIKINELQLSSVFTPSLVYPGNFVFANKVFAYLTNVSKLAKLCDKFVFH